MREQKELYNSFLQEYLLSSFSLDMIDLAAVRRLFIRVLFKSYGHGAALSFAVADRPGLSLKCSMPINRKRTVIHHIIDEQHTPN